MFTRLRWFLYGVIVAVAAGVFVVRRARNLKVRLDAEGIGRIAASYAADIVEASGRYLQQTATSRDDAGNS